MKKLITKTLSMILMLAMTLSMTAMAATQSNADIIAQRETNPNWHAWIDFLHASDKWASKRHSSGSPITSGWDLRHRDKIGTYQDLDTKNYSASYEGYENKFPDYESPYGGVIETWNYLNTHFETDAADGWLYALKSVDQDYREGWHPTRTAARANELLNYITTDFNDEFAKFLATYGKDAAGDFGFIRVTSNAFAKVNLSENPCACACSNACKTCVFSGMLSYDDYIEQKRGGIFGLRPLADPTEQAVITILVNGKPVEFNAIIRTNAKGETTTYGPLSDICAALGFNHGQSRNGNYAISRTDVFAEKTTDVRDATNGLAEYDRPEHDYTKIINIEGQPYKVDTVCNPTMYNAVMYNEAMYNYNLNVIASLMNATVNGTASTGISITVPAATAPVVTAPVVVTAPATSIVTITVNNKPVELEAVILNAKGGATTYLKLRDIGTATGFNVNWDANNIAISRTNVFAAKTTANAGEPTLAPGTVATRVIVEGQPYKWASVILTDAKGGATTYFKLRDVGEAMNFNVDWNANTGISVSNK